jgi:hypothetical protein
MDFKRIKHSILVGIIAATLCAIVLGGFGAAIIYIPLPVGFLIAVCWLMGWMYVFIDYLSYRE